MALAIVLVLLVIGSLLFHFMSPWYFTPLASNWGAIDFTTDVTFLVCGIVFVAVNLFTAYCVVRYRHRTGSKAHYEPESRKLETWLTALTAVGVAAMLTPGLFVWGEFIQTPDDSNRIEVLGRQWHWAFRMPGDDGELGNTSVDFMSVDNPFGIDPEDPAGSDDILVNEPIVHVPVDEPVETLLRSPDVLHNFAVPQFRVKMDLVPGMVTYQWFEPTRTGRYDLLCEELCGIAHFAMRGRVVVDEREDYEEWLAEQPTFAETMARPEGDAEAGQANYATCASCHGQQAEGNQSLNAPKLTGMSRWYMRRQLENYKEGIRGADPADTYGAQMAPMARTLTTDQVTENVLAYIDSLPDTPADETVIGDVERGRRIYTTCAACHGPEGEGRWSTNAPRLAGQDDWYLKRQLENFRQRIRGGHPDDLYGDQMYMMAATLGGEQAINDVVAYINTLQ